MNLKQAIKVLGEHNRWRRDNNVPAKTKMTEPKILGMALDRVIEELNKVLIPNVRKSVCDHEYVYKILHDHTAADICTKCGNIKKQTSC